MKHPIDLEHWNRKEHFLFFGSMDDPFFGLTTQIDVTSIYKEAKADHASFFLYSLHKIRLRRLQIYTGQATVPSKRTERDRTCASSHRPLQR